MAAAGRTRVRLKDHDLTGVSATSVVGCGYVGPVTAACLSHLGHRVVCVDRDEERIKAPEEGRVPFYKPGLEELISRGIHAERLSFAGADAGLSRASALMEEPKVIVDGRNVLEPADAQEAGLLYRGFGRGP